MAVGVDAELLEWGEKLFARKRRGGPGAAGGGGASCSRFWTARSVRHEIRLAVRRAPQVMVKVTGGGRGMRVIRTHLKYIDREGSGLIDQDGLRHEGAAARQELAKAWAVEGTPIPEHSDRREAFNIMWSMPGGIEAELVLAAVRKVAKESFADHRYVMALHSHQANPHVHLVVRAESNVSARRLNPRKADLRRWRTEFAAQLRALGIEAAATRQAVRGVAQRDQPLWQQKARGEGRLQGDAERSRGGALARESRHEVLQAWHGLAAALLRSEDADDRDLAKAIVAFVGRMPATQEQLAKARRQVEHEVRQKSRQQIAPRERNGPER